MNGMDIKIYRAEPDFVFLEGVRTESSYSDDATDSVLTEEIFCPCCALKNPPVKVKTYSLRSFVKSIFNAFKRYFTSSCSCNSTNKCSI